MIKNSVLALATAALVAGAALPAFANTGSISDDTFYSTDEVDSDYTLLRLKEKGIDAVSVEEWNGLVRAFVTQDDGREVMQLFDADTLTPVQL